MKERKRQISKTWQEYSNENSNTKIFAQEISDVFFVHETSDNTVDLFCCILQIHCQQSGH